MIEFNNAFWGVLIGIVVGVVITISVEWIKKIFEDKNNRNIELIGRCVSTGEDALIIKTADIIDSFKWYESQGNEDQLVNYCIKNAKLIFEYKPVEFDDKIFNKLKSWQNKYE